jgi:hypothetical protein
MATVTVLLLPREARKSAITTELARLVDFDGFGPLGATFVVEGRAAA